jgi:hypothetical protein
MSHEAPAVPPEVLEYVRQAITHKINEMVLLAMYMLPVDGEPSRHAWHLWYGATAFLPLGNPPSASAFKKLLRDALAYGCQALRDPRVMFELQPRIPEPTRRGKLLVFDNQDNL